jgi:hypothetical protein
MTPVIRAGDGLRVGNCVDRGIAFPSNKWREYNTLCHRIVP